MNDPVGGGSWSPRTFLTHLNQRHPDTVLFLTRHLATDPELSAAEFIDVDGAQRPGRSTTAAARYRLRQTR
jgi:hypothetical protein